MLKAGPAKRLTILEEKINKLLAALDSMVHGGCLISVSDVTVVKYAEHPTTSTE